MTESSQSPDDLFAEAQSIRDQITIAGDGGDADLVAQLEEQLAQVRQRAKLAAFDPVAGGEELLLLRHQLRQLSKRQKRRVFNNIRGGDEQTIYSKLPDEVQFAQDSRERIEKRIYELEESLIALNAMGDIPPLNEHNVDKWW